MIPQWLKDLLDKNDFEAINKAGKTAENSSDTLTHAWATFGKAECLRTGWPNQPADLSKAYQLYDTLLNKPNLPDDLRNRATFGKSECFNGWHPADKRGIYRLYDALLNKLNLPDDLRQRATFYQAECLLAGWPNQPADLSKAYQLYDTLLNKPNLPDDLRQRATFYKAECLRIGWLNHPADKGRAYQLYEMLLKPNLPDSLHQCATFSKAECLRIGWPNHPADKGRAYQLYEMLLNQPNLSDDIRKRATLSIGLSGNVNTTKHQVLLPGQQFNTEIGNIKEELKRLTNRIHLLEQENSHLKMEITQLKQQNLTSFQSPSSIHNVAAESQPYTSTAQLLNNHSIFQQPFTVTVSEEPEVQFSKEDDAGNNIHALSQIAVKREHLETDDEGPSAKRKK
jgi:regulator of replication initiation timing